MEKVKYYAKENSSIGTFSLSQMTKAKLVSALITEGGAGQGGNQGGGTTGVVLE